MCLAIPEKLLRIDGDVGYVKFAGTERRIGLALVPDAKVGDFVLVHAGFAIQRMDAAEAAETLQLIEELFPVEARGHDGTGEGR